MHSVQSGVIWTNIAMLLLLYIKCHHSFTRECILEFSKSSCLETAVFKTALAYVFQGLLNGSVGKDLLQRPFSLPAPTKCPV